MGGIELSGFWVLWCLCFLSLYQPLFSMPHHSPGCAKPTLCTCFSWSPPWLKYVRQRGPTLVDSLDNALIAPRSLSAMAACRYTFELSPGIQTSSPRILMFILVSALSIPVPFLLLAPFSCRMKIKRMQVNRC